MPHRVRVTQLAIPLLAAIVAASLACHNARCAHGQCVVCCAAEPDEKLDDSNRSAIDQTSGGFDTCCQLGDPWKLSDSWRCPIVVGGWTQVGYHTNDNGLFNKRPHQVQLHEQWTYVEKTAQAECGWDWGFRVDALYGTDGQDFQAVGSSPSWFDNTWDSGRDYGWSLPQAFLEVAVEGLSVQIGHFYTSIGHEYGTAPDDFFYSHTYTFFHSEPFTHTGVLATYTVSNRTEIQFGWVDGWDTALDFTGGNQFLGGINQRIGDGIQVLYAFLVGERERGTEPVGSGYNHSLVIEAAITDRLQSVLQYDLTDYSQIDDHDHGVNQRFIYTASDRLAYGGRVEWWHTPAGGGTSSDLYALTLGMNIRPHVNLVFRPEVRWDWNRDGALGIAQAGLGEPVNRLNGDVTFAIDAVIVF